MNPLSAALLVLTCLGTLYCVLSTLALTRHFRRRSSAPPPAGGPSVSILKPVCGLDPEARYNLLTFLSQDYPDYEVRFGVLEPDDPAAPLVRELASDFAHASVHVGARISGSNNKVRILDKLAADATGDILVIADADTRATPDFLRTIMAPFEDASVGAVTCLYRGVSARRLGDALHALHMSCVFAPGVAAAACLGRVDFGLGAAIAVRRTVLEEIGGFAAIVDYLADDFQLGRRVARTGARVVICDYVVDVVLGGETVREALSREVRWSRTTRISRPRGHAGLAITFGLPYALFFLLASGFDTLGWWVFGGALAIRAITAFVGARVCLGDREYVSNAYLLPLRDLLSLGVWIVGYLSRTVVWRGRRLRLLGDGRMVAPI